MMNLKAIGIVAIVIAAAGYFAPQAQAQDPENIADAMSREVFARSGDLYRNVGIDRQFTLLFGVSLADHEDFGDARSVEKLYRDGMRQQAGQVIQTQDLPNPYDTSIGSMR